MTENQIAVIPLEVIQDRRLTLEQTRVLIALFSFRNKVTNTVWPSRQAIAERTGMHPSNISNATTGLALLGWLIKDGSGGYSKATRYTITVPDLICATVAQSATVAEQTTVAQSATKTVAEQATRRIAEQATRKEQSKEQSKEREPAPAPVVAASFPDLDVGMALDAAQEAQASAQAQERVKTQASAQTAAPPAKPEKKKEAVKTAKPSAISKPDEVTSQVWADFLQVRKAKRSPLTATALAGIEREAAKAGIGLQQALEVCCESGWAGFKADWYANRTAQDALRRTSRAGNTHKHAAAAAAIFEGVWEQ